MCGIFCVLLNANNVKHSECNVQKCLDDVYVKCKNNINKRGPDYQNSTNTQVNDWHLLLASSVLWLQGTELVQQPIETDRSWFLYNGDIFDSDLLSSDIRNHNGDTRPLLNLLEHSDDLVNTLSHVHGPYAFIYINKTTSKLYFTRDIYGRRSLLIGKDDTKITITSVSCRHIDVPMIELPPLGIYCLDLNKNLTLSLYTWCSGNQHFDDKLQELETFLGLKILVCNKENNVIPYVSPKMEELIVFETVQKFEPEKLFETLLSHDPWKSNVDKLRTLLENAVEQRVKNQPQFCENCFKDRLKCEHPLIGILFSGGLDCAIISLIADQYVDKNRPIDLLNVAFERGGYDTPDRLTGYSTWKELEVLRPNRKWNFLEINVTHQELDKERNGRISDLIFPLRTIMDESLGCALWFAARGRTENYSTPCRVLFVGMGADELFGGYTRHRAAFKRGGWDELTKELDNDWKSISYRNLARDDRVVSDHGRQLRTPYLDENVVEFVRKLHAWERCCPDPKITQSLGEKMLLRTLAFDLGLTRAALIRKRALQFGSRIANNKENAFDISPRL